MSRHARLHAELRLALGHLPRGMFPLISAAALLALLAYCLGHGLFTGESIDFGASLRWSLAHAIGLGLIGFTAYRLRHRPWLLRCCAALAAGFAGSALIAGTGLHAYASVAGYVAFACAASALLAPAAGGGWLELDFGRTRRLVAPGQVIAVHGARNYAEVEIRDAARPGLARMTLQEMLRLCSTRLIRVHRSHLVDPQSIVDIRVAARGSLTVRLCNGREVPVSARYAAAVRALASVPAAEDSSHGGSAET